MATKTFLTCVVLAIVGFGCASPPVDKYYYTPPTEPPNIQNEVIVGESFSQVWDSLIGELSKSFFVINNVEKASRIINLSFTTSKPEEYTDCGSSSRQHSFMGETRNYEYQVSESSRYKWGGVSPANAQVFWVADVQRKPSLSGRINVYVAPSESSGTKISVNTRYVVLLPVSGVATIFNAYGVAVGTERMPLDGSVTEITFNTHTKGTWDVGDGTLISCYANGALEASILDLIRQSP